MSEHQKQSDFLKALIHTGESEDHRRLRERILMAESNEKCIWRAVRMMGLITLLAGAALGHLAVLLPEFFDRAAPLLVRVVSAFALAAGICFVMFLGYWLWHRALVNRAHDECRRFLLSSRHGLPELTVLPDLDATKLDGSVTRIETPNPIQEERLLRLRNRS